MKSLNTDTFFSGQLRVKQDRSGYRFSIDAVLLANHANPRAGDRVLDLGTGCGIIPLILAYRNPGVRLYGIEVQTGLAELAILNIKENRMADRITVLCQDMKALKPGMISGPVDLVVCNPPYRMSCSGRINPDQQRAVARHEIKVTLYDIVQTARRMLKTAGRLVTIYAAERITELLSRMRSDRIEPKFVRTIHSQWHSDAKLILVEGIKGGRPGIKIAPPLILYNEDGEYSAEVQQMFIP